MYIELLRLLTLIIYYRATSIYTTQAYVRISNAEIILLDVMLVGTNDGKILKIVMTYNDANHIPLITEKLSVCIDIRNVINPLCIDQLVILCLPSCGVLLITDNTKMGT